MYTPWHVHDPPSALTAQTTAKSDAKKADATTHLRM